MSLCTVFSGKLKTAKYNILREPFLLLYTIYYTYLLAPPEGPGTP